jgi:DNA-binding IclR family transcriptional regulator
MRGLDVVALAREELDRLRERTGEAAHFSVWSDRGPCIVLNVNGARPLPFASRVGFMLPLLSTATGRAFLAYQPKSETAEILRAEMAQGRWTDGDVEAISADVRRLGLSYTASMLNSGLAALAAPIFDYSSAIQGVVTLIGPREAFPADISSPQGAALRDSAAALCARLGRLA